MGVAVCAGLYPLARAMPKKAAPSGAAFFFGDSLIFRLQLAGNKAEMYPRHQQQEQRHRQRHAHRQRTYHAFARTLVLQHEISRRTEAIDNEHQEKNHHVFHTHSVIQAAMGRH